MTGTLRRDIETPRLILRPPCQADIPALVRELGRLAVSRWLGRVPHPYTARHARQFLAVSARAREEGRDLAFAVAVRGKPSLVIGGIGAHHIDSPHPVIGYWLAQRHWGKGYAGEALGALLAELLRVRPQAHPAATAMRSNLRSQRVLLSCGFKRQPGRRWLRCLARGHKVEVLRFSYLSPSKPAAGPCGLSTPRLSLVPAEPDAVPRGAMTLGGRPLLPPPGDVPAWRNFDCIANRDTRVGTCGLLFREDGGVEIGYRIEPQHRRKGFAGEALRALVRHAFESYGLDALEAEVADDNRPSLALLARLGFAGTGRRREQWSNRRNAYISYEVHRLGRGDWNRKT